MWLYISTSYNLSFYWSIAAHPILWSVIMIILHRAISMKKSVICVLQKQFCHAKYEHQITIMHPPISFAWYQYCSMPWSLSFTTNAYWKWYQIWHFSSLWQLIVQYTYLDKVQYSPWNIFLYNIYIFWVLLYFGVLILMVFQGYFWFI